MRGFTLSKSTGDRKTSRFAATLLSITLIGFILYSAKVVIVPIALAVLLTFILSPLVTLLDRWRLHRIPAVITVVAAAGLLVGGMTWLVVSQVGSLAADLPKYRTNIQRKVEALRKGTRGGIVDNVHATIDSAAGESEEKERTAPTASDGRLRRAQDPIPVEIVPPAGNQKALGALRDSLLALSPAFGGLATGGFVLVLVIFMLINREDLRNRLVSFTTNGNLAVTTKALDDAGQRISRYLLMQLVINGAFGIAVGIGLLIIGVPYALLWALCAAVLRYIPYIGPWFAASLPLGISLITSPGWSQFLLVLGMFVVLELISNNVMEPWLYGQNVGISVVALLISAAFWTWIWGSVGLVLATPLTVCLVVIGQYVPGLAFLDRLLGDRPALQPYAAYLQRLLARDAQEAEGILKQYVRDRDALTVYDEVLVPALAAMRQDRTKGTITADEESFVIDTTRSILAELSDQTGITSDDQEKSLPSPTPQLTNPDSTAGPRGRGNADTIMDSEPLQQPGHLAAAVSENGARFSAGPVVLGCPAHQEAEELTLSMLDHLTRPAGLSIDVISTRTLPSDVVARVKRERPTVVVISVLPPGGLVQTQYLCRTLHKRFPELGIVVGCWGYRGNLDKIIVKLRAAGAHHITTTLLGAQNHVLLLTDLSNSSRVGSLPNEPQAVSTG